MAVDSAVLDVRPDKSYVRTTAGSDCWYVNGHLCDFEMSWLIDTGASPNVLDRRSYECISSHIRPTLHPVTNSLQAAEGSALKVYGQANFVMYIDSQEFTVDFVVADLNDIQGILGMEFLSQCSCIIDACNGELKIGPLHIAMKKWDGPTCSSIKVSKYVTVLPGTEKVIFGTFDNSKWDTDSKLGIVESLNSFTNSVGVMVTDAVVELNGPEVLLTATNFGDEPVTINKGITVAMLKSVQKVMSLKGNVTTNYPNKQLSDLPEHLQDMVKQTLAKLDPKYHMRVCGMIHENQDVFLEPGNKLGRTHLVKHKIDTGDANPIKRRAYKPAISQKPIIEDQIEEMLAARQIVPSSSPWASPVVLVKKKDGSSRFCVDYRALNQVTLKDSYPIPNIQDCIDTLSGSNWFSTLDLASGYWQCEVDESDQPKTAFITHKGLYQFRVLPFGLTNAPATFERLMERVLSGMLGEQCLVYLDDIIAFGGSFEIAMQNLQQVLNRIREAGLTLKPKKCRLFRQSVSFLGHVVSSEGVSCDPEKIEAVKSWETPKTVTDIRSFLGFANYYRRFIKSFAHIASPLTALTQKNVIFEWSDECELAFQCLKQKLVEAPVLAYPTQESNSKYILDTDASLVGIGGVLSQTQNGVERVIAYASQTLSKSERNYCTTYRELLAVVRFVKHFRHYLLGENLFLIRTDHSSLRWLMNFKDPEGLISRWLLSLQPFNFEIKHRKGINHGNADGLSRKEPVLRRRRCNRGECEECPLKTPVTVVTTRSKTITLETGSSNMELNDVDRNKSQIQKDKYVSISDSDSSELNANENCEVRSGSRNRPQDNSCIDVEQSLTCESESEYAHTSQEVDSLGELLSDVGQLDSNWLVNWTREDLQAMQKEDHAIQKVVSWKESGGRRPSRVELLSESNDVRDYCGLWSSLVLIDGVLYRRWRPKCVNRDCFQLIVSSKIREDILKQLHDSRTAGHLGHKRSLMKVRQRFFWPRCKQDVIRWCRQCSVCARTKPGPRFRAKLQQLPVRNKLDRVALDILGELPETENGNKYILVVSDYYTKWTHAMAMPNQLAQTVADKLLNEFITIFGVPKYLHTDQGRNFESNLFQQMCLLLGIEKTRTTPFHAQSDGQVERWNRTIQQMLKAFVNKNRDDWDDHLPYLCMAYRATPHESTGCSPNLMMFGQENNLPLDVMVGHPPKAKPSIECPVEYVEWLRSSFTEIYKYANKQLGQNAQRQKYYYDIRSKSYKYNTGCFVWRWYPPVARGKLSIGWTGPYRVVQCVNEVNCLIKFTPESPQFRVHTDALKPYEGPTPKAWEGFREDGNDQNTNSGILTQEMSDDTEILNTTYNMVTAPDCTDTENDGSDQNDGIPVDFNSSDSEISDIEELPPECESPKGRGYRIKKPLIKFSPSM